MNRFAVFYILRLAESLLVPLPDRPSRDYNPWTMTNHTAAYKEALEYLYSFVDFSMQKSVTYSPERFKLERMEALVASLGNPQNAYPSIHVAGTKGKGSVCILCATALQEAGYKVGLYTSPHLDDYAERIQINGEFIPHSHLVEMVEEIKPYVAAVPEITTFEITTALAFLYFAKQKVDAAVIEVGLGGRLDATNVITPKVCVITSISYDHVLLLGNTLAEIAGEKAGIIKPGVPVVSSPQVEEARIVIEDITQQHGSSLIQVGRDYQYMEIVHSLRDQKLSIWSSRDGPGKAITLIISLLGAHQATNAATAYACLKVFDGVGVKVEQKALKRGFSHAFWPGRFEIVHDSPPVVLDCAHNRDSALKLRNTVSEYYPGKKIILVFGASEDKDIEGMLAELMPLVKELIAVKSFHPRAIEPANLADMAKSNGHSVELVENIPDAVEKALELTGDDCIVLVTGSIFVVAEARKYWEKKAGIRRY
jgi:dihydrofolate synthase/folylpolyglutamate synthase